jgi:hypothetical protein
MQDKHGVEIKTGDIVEITGAYFKNDNGLYFLEHSPGDPSWSGSGHCLKRISKTGKISNAKYSLCFWPISSYVSDRFKSAQAARWNKEHAVIEVKDPCKDMSEVIAFFQTQADNLMDPIRWAIYDWGGEHPTVQMQKEIQNHYTALAQAMKK